MNAPLTPHRRALIQEWANGAPVFPDPSAVSFEDSPTDTAESLTVIGEAYGAACAEHGQGARAGLLSALDRLILEAARLRSEVSS